MATTLILFVGHCLATKVFKANYQCGMGVGDHRVDMAMMKGGYRPTKQLQDTLNEMHSTMHLMHPN